jgi:predicted TIM-barrel fold metal-dependent hydrolase
MPHVEFGVFDCDNHYYEPADAFTRHIDPIFRRRAMQWATIGAKERLLVAGKINRFIPNPTFDPVSKPGALDEYFRGRNPRGQDTPELFGELERLATRPEYFDRLARLRIMDTQGIEGAIFLPTLGVGMEQALIADPEALIGAFTAFNRWLEEDWGFAFQERIFAAPIVTLVDAESAVRELDWALDHDARFILMMPGPVMTPSGARSPVDPDYDRFWARVNESGATVVLHGGDSLYTKYLAHWGERAEHESFRQSSFKALISHSAIQDHVANLLANGLFQRFPNIRVAAIETGSDWVFHLFEKLKKVFGQLPHTFPEDPRDTFRQHIWVSPFYEDRLSELKDLIGVDRLLMGSDFPHAEGLAEPTAYIRDLRNADFSDAESKRVMRDNGRALARRIPI